MIAVIACGNLNRSDDGAGPAVLRLLRQDPALSGQAGLRLYDAATDGLAVMFQARGCDELLLLDASRGGQEPGSIHELPGEAFVSRREPPRDSHALRWDDALTIGQRLYREDFPGRVRVFLIEAGNLSLGLELSPAVDRSARLLAGRLAKELRTRLEAA